jgi:hypothetical protein
MADGKTGTKPEKEGGSGAEKDEAQGAEVEGRHRHHRTLYTCWRGGASNYVHSNLAWFTCWRCGALNYM